MSTATEQKRIFFVFLILLIGALVWTTYQVKCSELRGAKSGGGG